MSYDDDKRALCAVWEWTHQCGAALKPPGADTYGEGMRDAKEQVQRLLSGDCSTAKAEQALRNLVAVIDRDGGQTQRGESVTASGERAEAVVIGERVATDTTTAVQRQRVKDMSACVTTLENELSALRAQRDEARELVRRYVEGDCLYDELNEERACNAVLRWDEEAKR